ncbi:MAG: S9 family peptidase [Erysipelotrichaceae bacterium]|nr:S9 family peptidase [Erysipelotrichaceae bacterium]
MPAKKLNPITIEDITKYRFPANLRYSPDGKMLAFHAGRSDVEKNCYHNDVYLVKDGKTCQLTYSLDATFVIWQDENTLILRRTSGEALPGTTELFTLDVRGGEAKPWITLPFPMASLAKVSDTVYAAKGFIDANDPDAYKDSDEDRKKKFDALKKEADYHVVDEVPYWFNGVGFNNKRRTAVFDVRVGEKLQVKRVTAPKFNTGDLTVCGTKVFFAGNVKENRQLMTQKIFEYDTETKKLTTLYGKNDRSVGQLFVMNNQLYAWASDMKKFGPIQTKDICKVTKNSLEVVMEHEDVTYGASVIGDTVHGGGFTFATDGTKLVSIVTIDNHNALWEFDKDFNKTCLWEGPGMMCFLDVTADQIAVCFQDWNNVAEMYVMGRDGKNMTQVSSLNDAALEGKYIAKPEVIKYTSEGYDLTGWVLLPQDFNPKKKYPAVLDIHGGPRASYGETFFHEMQLWVSRGFVVFFTNIKGSDGRGDAFADIRDDYGGTDFRNLMDFTDAVLAKYPNIDQTKVCETGGSYGGFMTNWIIGHTDRFCACASQRSIANWISFSFIADIGLHFGPAQNGCDGLFSDADHEKMWNHSPLKYAENVKTPTLFIHSDEDFRCPLPEGMQMMQSLAVRDIETRLVIFHGENHELSRSGKPQHRMRRLQEITDWFENHVK